MAEVESLLKQVSVGKASHILVGDSSGACLSVEFAGRTSHRLEPLDDILLHTNHYLADEGLNAVEAFPTTRERLQQGQEIVAVDASSESLHKLLRDQSRGVESICRPYSLSETPGFGAVGSVFTLLMDLVSGVMQIQRGPGREADPYEVMI
jgi:hypothetical protein